MNTAGSAAFRVGSNLIGQPKRKHRTGGAETRRSEEGRMPGGENESFPPLTSASPRLLFDFLPALISPKVLRKDPHETPQSHKKLRTTLTMPLSLTGWPAFFLATTG